MKIEVDVDDDDLDNIVRQSLVDNYTLICDDLSMKKQAKVLRKTIEWYSTTPQWKEFKELFSDIV